LRPSPSRRRLSRALVVAVLCVAACTANNHEPSDGGDAATEDAPDTKPAESSLPDQTASPRDGAPGEAMPEGSSSGADSSSSGGSSSGMSSSSGSADGGSSSGGDSAPPEDGSADATIETGGDADVEASVDASVDAGSDATGCARGMTNANQVVVIGDSYLDPLFSATGTDIVADAQNAGALAANMTYRHYYQGGAALNSGMGPLSIPFQYEMLALMDPTVSNPSDINTVIMNGGASDFLLADRTCLFSPPTFGDGGVRNASCYNTVQGAMNRLAMLMQEMAQKGVKHIVYFFYPHLDPTGGGLLTTPAPSVNDTIDYAASQAQQVCETVPHCVFVDSRPAFEGQTAQYISGDRLNPSATGAQVLADLVWQTMVDHCIAQ